MSAVGSATQIVGGVWKIATLYKVAGAIRADARTKVRGSEDLTAAEIDARSFTPHEVTVETPETGVYITDRGALLQRSEQAPDRSWIAPVALGVVGVGILAFLYLR